MFVIELGEETGIYYWWDLYVYGWPCV